MAEKAGVRPTTRDAGSPPPERFSRRIAKYLAVPRREAPMNERPARAENTLPGRDLDITLHISLPRIEGLTHRHNL